MGGAQCVPVVDDEQNRPRNVVVLVDYGSLSHGPGLLFGSFSRNVVGGLPQPRREAASRAITDSSSKAPVFFIALKVCINLIYGWIKKRKEGKGRAVCTVIANRSICSSRAL